MSRHSASDSSFLALFHISPHPFAGLSAVSRPGLGMPPTPCLRTRLLHTLPKFAGPTTPLVPCRMLSNNRKQQTGDGTLTPVLRMLAGAVAGIIAMSSTYHLDMVRGRLTVQEGTGRTQQYRGIMHAYQDIIQKVRPRPSAPTHPHPGAYVLLLL